LIDDNIFIQDRAQQSVQRTAGSLRGL